MTTYDFQAFCVISLMAIAMMLLIFYRWSYYILMLGDVIFMALIVLAVVGTVVFVGFLLGSLYYSLAMKQAKAEREMAKADHERAKAIAVSQQLITLQPGHSLYTNQALTALHAPALPAEQTTPLLPMPSDDTVLPLAEWWAMANELHTMLVGQSNSGKSYTAKAMLAYRFANGGKGVIIDPHYEMGDWWGLPVVGAKRNFRQIDDTFLAILADMSRRFEFRSNLANCKFEEVTIVVDEVPAINANCKHWDKFVSTMSSEARKVNYKLIVLSQSRLVEAFGLKGKSDMRENFSELLLGDFAVKAAKPDKVMAVALAGRERGGVLDCRGLSVIDLSGINQFLEVEIPKNCIYKIVSGNGMGNTEGQADTDKPHEKWDLILDLARAGLSGNAIFDKVRGNRNETLKAIREAKLQLEHESTGQTNGYHKVVMS